MKRRFLARLSVLALTSTALPLLTSSPVRATPPECQLWVTSRISDSATIIDTATSDVSTLDVGNSQWVVAMAPDGSKVYFSTSSQGIKIVDVANNYAVSSINQASFTLGVSPDGTRLYSASWGDDILREYNAVTDSATGRTAATYPRNPTAVAASPDGSVVYVAIYNSTTPSTVTKVATSDFTSTNISLGANNLLPAGLAVSPNGAFLYVITYSGSVRKIDTVTDTVLATVAVNANSRGIAVNSTGTRLYVSSSLLDTVQVIDTVSMTVLATIPVGVSPQNLVISPNDRFVFVANQMSDSVSRIDTATNTVVETIAVNPEPFGIAIGPASCTSPELQQSPAPESSTPTTSIWRVAMDPNGGSCTDGSKTYDEKWTSVFVGYRYLPGEDDCVGDGLVFTGWALASAPTDLLNLPLLIDPSDGKKRAFVAASYDLVAMWFEPEIEEVLEDLSGTAPGTFVGGPDRRTLEGGGVVIGYYIPPGIVFGPWALPPN